MAAKQTVYFVGFSSTPLPDTVQYFQDKGYRIVSICNWITPNNFSSNGYVIVLEEVEQS